MFLSKIRNKNIIIIISLLSTILVFSAACGGGNEDEEEEYITPIPEGCEGNEITNPDEFLQAGISILDGNLKKNPQDDPMAPPKPLSGAVVKIDVEGNKKLVVTSSRRFGPGTGVKGMFFGGAMEQPQHQDTTDNEGRAGLIFDSSDPQIQPLILRDTDAIPLLENEIIYTAAYETINRFELEEGVFIEEGEMKMSGSKDWIMDGRVSPSFEGSPVIDICGRMIGIVMNAGKNTFVTTPVKKDFIKQVVDLESADNDLNTNVQSSNSQQGYSSQNNRNNSNVNRMPSNSGMTNQPMPNQPMPNQPMPNQSMPNQSMPNQSMPNMGGSMMGGSMGGGMMPGVMPDQAFISNPSQFMLEPRSCEEIYSSPSKPNSEVNPSVASKEIVLFIGTMGIAADIYWKDFQNSEQLYLSIPAQSMNPGDHLVMTFPEHTWIVREPNGNCIAGYVVKENEAMKSNAWNIMIGMPLEMVQQMKGGMGGMMMGGSMMGGSNNGMMRP
ncbi:MAG: hypothetical protein CL717_03240 [Chloroflexi bacterium]|nr:hypothetical protein [Chloroflexota bacterium]